MHWLTLLHFIRLSFFPEQTVFCVLKSRQTFMSLQCLKREKYLAENWTWFFDFISTTTKVRKADENNESQEKIFQFIFILLVNKLHVERWFFFSRYFMWNIYDPKVEFDVFIIFELTSILLLDRKFHGGNMFNAQSRGNEIKLLFRRLKVSLLEAQKYTYFPYFLS